MPEMLFDKPEIEYIDGRPYPKVSPKRTHSMVQSNLVRILQASAGKRGAAGTEWRFRMTADTSLVPDVAYVSYDRLRSLTDEQAEEPPFAPDIAGEVRSPSHRAGLLREKIQQYLDYGAVLVLDVDPAHRVVHAHTKEGEATFASGDRFRCDSLPWLEFDVAALFERLEIPR